MSKYPEEKSGLVSQAKRTELIHVLKELCNADLQNRLWVKHEDYPNSSGIDEVIHFLFDDTELGYSPSSEVGRILFDEIEVGVIERLTAVLSEMLDRLGDASSAEFMDDNSWPRIMSEAQVALNTIEAKPCGDMVQQLPDKRN